MNRIGTFAGGMSLAIGMALAGIAFAATDQRPAPAPDDIRFFLADPELGVAGVYTGNGAELYFEARRAFDAQSGAPGALSLRVIDGEARTLAFAGQPFAEHWIARAGEFPAGAGFAHSRELAGLGAALAASDLHVSLAAEKSALADLARQAAEVPAASYPVQASVKGAGVAGADVAAIADFYQRSLDGVEVHRARDGMLEARLGNGIVMRNQQTWIADEPDENGRMGRIDAYSMVKAADGYVLASELGGDEVPSDWSDALEIDNERDHHDLASDFGRAATALNALAYSGRSIQGDLERDNIELSTMQRLAQTMTGHLLPERGDRADRAVTATGRYQTYIQVWRKPFVLIAEHSGTRVGKYLYNSTTSSTRTHQGWVSYCNHGACAAASSMTHKCTYTGPRMSWYRLPSRRTDAGGHTCSTGYWAVDLIGHHNCHDDSSVQVRAVRGQSYSITSGRCSDWVFWSHAPTCGVQ